MIASQLCALACVRRRIDLRTLLPAFTLLLAMPAMAAETVTMNLESQVLDLDAGAVLDASPTDPAGPVGADVRMAYNADRTPHAVVLPTGDGVEIAFIAGVGYDAITSSDVASLTFSAEAPDLAFSADDCVVVRTDQDAYFKLGNAAENGLSITFNYQQL